MGNSFLFPYCFSEKKMINLSWRIFLDTNSELMFRVFIKKQN